MTDHTHDTTPAADQPVCCDQPMRLHLTESVPGQGIALTYRCDRCRNIRQTWTYDNPTAGGNR